MTFINLKHFKETVATVTKISDSKNPTVKISLSKHNDLSFRILFGMDGLVSLPVESQTIKDRSQTSSKDAIVSVEILSRIVKNLGRSRNRVCAPRFSYHWWLRRKNKSIEVTNSD